MDKHGSASAALKRYIASFGASGKPTELGSQPPCRSYRSLRVLDELVQEEEAALRAATTKEELAACCRVNKVSKAAYNDLLTMARGAATRFVDAVKSAEANRKRTSQQRDDAAAAA